MEATEKATHHHPLTSGTPTEPAPGGRVTVMGLGLFGGGVAAARYFAERGCRVTVTDLKSAEALSPSLEALDGLPVTYHLGEHRPGDFTSADLVVVNPAVPPTSKYVALAREAGVGLTSEMNLFVERCPARVVGVTGTNGKSTTTALLGDALGRAMPTRVGGNIGRSLLGEIEAIRPDETVVLELSSFQLHDLGRTRRSPHVAVVTCLAPNHIDWHGSLDAYYDAKRNIVRYQGKGDLAVLNADDPEQQPWAEGPAGRVLRYSAAGDPEADAAAEGEMLRFRFGGPGERIDLAGRLRLAGRHNVANVLATATAARALGTPLEAIGEAIAALRPLPHRLEPVGRIGDVLVVDDSKATTPQAARAALEAFDRPILLIAGGYDKKTDPGPMVEAARRRARALVLIGTTAAALADALGDGGPDVVRAETMDEAVREAVDRAERGDVLLLAPGHASWDMFENYERRGEAFRRAAEALGMTRLGEDA